MRGEEEVMFSEDTPEFNGLLAVLREWVKRRNVARASNCEDGERIERAFTAFIEKNRPDLAKKVAADGGIYRAVVTQWCEEDETDDEEEEEEEEDE